MFAVDILVVEREGKVVGFKIVFKLLPFMLEVNIAEEDTKGLTIVENVAPPAVK